MLLGRRHRCWTAADAGLAAAQDDILSVYAAKKRAALVTMDREFSQRRLKNPIGHHVWLRCPEPDAAALLGAHLG
jgi:predicted nuclease of predicted toxin-antitoxin system